MSTAVRSISEAPTRLGDRLVALRDKYFVGRTAEVELFRSALLNAERPFQFLHVYGPGGVGKSRLVREFARVARAARVTVIALDGRDVEPSPAGFLARLRQVLGLPEAASPLQALDHRAPLVLLIDTYELLRPLDAWIRDVFLPQLPGSALVVAAGRLPPSPGWREDPAWSELGHWLPLRNLAPDDSRAYLQARGVPQPQHAPVLEFTHGHPLALSLLTDLLLHGGGQQSPSFRPADAPDVLRVLLQRFIEEVPSLLHWRALGVCAHARTTTEALLAHVIGSDAAREVFDWLRSLPFIEHGPHGLFPHDLAREVLDADLRWRDPTTYQALHDHICEWCLAQLQRTFQLERQTAYFDFLYLVRHNPIVGQYYDWTTFGQWYAEPAAPSDHQAILSMVLRHEGQDSAGIAAYWLGRQPEAFVAFRSSANELVGFTTALVFEAISAEDAAVDPAAAAASEFMRQHPRLRPGELLMHHRFFVGRDGYQDLTTHNMVAMVATARWLTTPRLALTLAATAQPDRWQPMFEPVNFVRAPTADFVVGGHRYGVFAHDWRADPPSVWVLRKFALQPAHDGQPSAVADPVIEVLSQPDFIDAVRQALRDYARPALATNPLLRSRLVIERSGGTPTAGCLQALLRETAEDLRSNARGAKLYRAIACTYFERAPTQELAAERLGLPFNTYRYQLATGTQRIAERLWEQELACGG